MAINLIPNDNLPMAELNDDDGSIASTVKNDLHFKQVELGAMNTNVTIGGVTKALKDFEEEVQFKFMATSRAQFMHVVKQVADNRQAIDTRFELAIAGGADPQGAAQTKAIMYGELDNQYKDALFKAQIWLDEKHLAAMQLVLASKVAAPVLVDDNDVPGRFRVEFKNSPITELKKETKSKIISHCEQHGPVDVNDLVFIKSTSNKIIVTYTNLQGKKKCIQAGVVGWLGTPCQPISKTYAKNIAKTHSAFVDNIPPGTTVDEITVAFAELEVPCESVKHLGDAAFINYVSEPELDVCLSKRNVTIGDRTLNIIAAKNSDPDCKKGILGFFTGQPIHVAKMYAALDKHVWDFLYIQPVFWDNGGLKHYYFIRFPSTTALDEARWSPIKIGSETLQVFPVERDDAGRMVFPPEGAWRAKKQRVADQAPAANPPPPPAPAVLKPIPPISLRSFS